MGVNRRTFLKIAGLSALMGAGGKSAFELLAPGELDAMEAPLPSGTKWGMVLDMTKFDDEVMDKCIEVCHRVHNVPAIPDKEEVKWIWKETYEHAFPGQHHEYVSESYHGRSFLLLCNHCTNPPCVRVCPTKATWKREEDGVVMMDQHRCIGCRFCMAACPFGARSFNYSEPAQAPAELNAGFPPNPEYPTRTKGVVEKCTFCAERLAKGQIPACVEEANKIKKGAMVFGDLGDPKSDIREVLRKSYTIRRKPELGTGPNIFYIV